MTLKKRALAIRVLKNFVLGDSTCVFGGVFVYSGQLGNQ
jgi:hypothetical protein